MDWLDWIFVVWLAFGVLGYMLHMGDGDGEWDGWFSVFNFLFGLYIIFCGLAGLIGVAAHSRRFRLRLF